MVTFVCTRASCSLGFAVHLIRRMGIFFLDTVDIVLKCGRVEEGGRIMRERKYCRVKRGRNILHAVQRKKGNWIGHIWRRNCLLSGVVEGKMEGT